MFRRIGLWHVKLDLNVAIRFDGSVIFALREMHDQFDDFDAVGTIDRFLRIGHKAAAHHVTDEM